MAPAARQSVARDALGRGDQRPGLAEDLGDGACLGQVVERRRGAVGVDVPDVGCRDAGVRQRQLHAGHGAGAVGRGGGDVVGVGGAGRPGQLGVDRGATRATARSQSSSTRAAAPSVITKPSRRASKGREMARGGERRHVGEGRQGDRVHAGLGAAAHGHVAAARRDQAGGGGDGVRAGGAGGADDLGRAAPPQPHGDAGRAGVGHHHRHQAGRDPVRPPSRCTPRPGRPASRTRRRPWRRRRRPWRGRRRGRRRPRRPCRPTTMESWAKRSSWRTSFGPNQSFGS